MPLTKFQRYKVRELVSLSTDLFAQHQALNDRRSALSARIRDDADRRVRKAREVIASPTYNLNHDLYDAHLREALEFKSELGDALKLVEDKFAVIAPYVSQAGQVAERILHFTGLGGEELAPVARFHAGSDAAAGLNTPDALSHLSQTRSFK